MRVPIAYIWSNHGQVSSENEQPVHCLVVLNKESDEPKQEIVSLERVGEKCNQSRTIPADAIYATPA
jgi:hypothetical protein